VKRTTIRDWLESEGWSDLFTAVVQLTILGLVAFMPPTSEAVREDPSSVE
jgi:hypothetical protein